MFLVKWLARRLNDNQSRNEAAILVVWLITKMKRHKIVLFLKMQHLIIAKISRFTVVQFGNLTL